MTESFDPYQEWLGIPPAEQPPHHYRLLGLPIFETDLEKVRAEADRRMQHVRTFQLGQRSHASQQILNELSMARVCLLGPASKARYDVALTEWLNARLPVPPPIVEPDPPPQGESFSGPPLEFDAPWAPAHSPVGELWPAAVTRPSAQSLRPSRKGWGTIAGIILLVVIASGATIYFKQRAANAEREEQAQKVAPVALPQSHETPASKLGGKSVVVPENVVLQSDDGDVNLHLARARLRGPTLKTDGDSTVGWSSPTDSLEWEFLIHKPGIFRILVTYAADKSSAGSRAQFMLSGRDQPIVMMIRDTGGRTTFTTDPVDKMFPIRRGGRYSLKISAAEQRGDVLMTLKGIELHREPVR